MLLHCLYVVTLGNKLHLFEGDIYLNNEDNDNTGNDDDGMHGKVSGVRMRRNVHRNRETLWPRREIPYEIDSSIPGKKITNHSL